MNHASLALSSFPIFLRINFVFLTQILLQPTRLGVHVETYFNFFVEHGKLYFGQIFTINVFLV